MPPDFWHARWANNEIGFHLDEVQPLLLEDFGRLGLATGDRTPLAVASELNGACDGTA